MSKSRAGFVMPARQYYFNTISIKRFGAILDFLVKEQQVVTREKMFKGLLGALALIELDYEADMNDIELDKEMTKKHYLKYVSVAKKYQDLNLDCLNNFISFVESY